MSFSLIFCSGESIFSDASDTTEVVFGVYNDITKFGDGSGSGTGSSTITDNGDGTFTQSNSGSIIVSETSGYENYTVNLTAKVLSNNGYGIYLRMQDTSSTNPDGYVFQIDFGIGTRGGYRAVIFPGDSSIVANRMCTAGDTENPHCIDGDKQSYNIWHDVKIIVTGNNYKCYINNKLIYDFTDSTYSGGSVGIRTWNNGDNVTFKNFTVTQN